MNTASLVTQIAELNSSIQEKLLEEAGTLLYEQNEGSKVNLLELEKQGYSPELCLDLLGTFIQILRRFAENGAKEFSKKMLADGYSEVFIQKCIAKLPELHPKTLELNRLISFKWRIDISFFDNNTLKKIPLPVIISLKTSNGKKVTIELNMKVFHKLRFAVSYLINELLTVKNIQQLKQ